MGLSWTLNWFYIQVWFCNIIHWSFGKYCFTESSKWAKCWCISLWSISQDVVWALAANSWAYFRPTESENGQDQQCILINKSPRKSDVWEPLKFPTRSKGVHQNWFWPLSLLFPWTSEMFRNWSSCFFLNLSLLPCSSPKVDCIWSENFVKRFLFQP